jgi:hypothetical protein
MIVVLETRYDRLAEHAVSCSSLNSTLRTILARLQTGFRVGGFWDITTVDVVPKVATHAGRRRRERL